MFWVVMKSISAATLKKMPGEPLPLVLLFNVSQLLAQSAPHEVIPGRAQMPLVIVHTRGPPESLLSSIGLGEDEKREREV